MPWLRRRDRPVDFAVVSCSIRVRADDLPLAARAQCPPGLDIDRALDEMDRAIAEGGIDAARVVAGRCHGVAEVAGRLDVVDASQAVRRVEVIVGVESEGASMSAGPDAACEPV